MGFARPADPENNRAVNGGVPRIGGIVLAAGRSERLGQPKALCRIGPTTLLARALGRLGHERVAATVVVVPRSLDLGDRLPAGVRAVANDRPELGPSWSVRLGIDALPGDLDGYLILPVDCPLVRDEDVAAIILAMRQEPDPAVRLWVPSFAGRRGHPLLVHRDLVPEIRALGTDEPLHRVVRADTGRVRHVAATHDGVLFDVDTPADLEEAARRVARAT